MGVQEHKYKGCLASSHSPHLKGQGMQVQILLTYVHKWLVLDHLTYWWQTWSKSWKSSASLTEFSSTSWSSGRQFSPFRPCPFVTRAALKLKNERFYDQLQYAVAKVPATEVLIPVGDWKGHVGAVAVMFSDAHGGYDLGTRNCKGINWICLCPLLDAATEVCSQSVQPKANSGDLKLDGGMDRWTTLYKRNVYDSNSTTLWRRKERGWDQVGEECIQRRQNIWMTKPEAETEIFATASQNGDGVSLSPNGSPIVPNSPTCPTPKSS